MVVGVTGKYCAGKSAVAAILVELGFARHLLRKARNEVDVDRIGHAALRVRREQVLDRFGRDLRAGDSVDRARLAGIIFGDRRARRDLERMLYPVMMQMIGDRIAEYAGGKVVIHAALLVRMGLHRFCQLVVWVNAPLYLRLRWARRRDGRSLREVLRVLRAQRDVRRSALGQQPPSMVVENRGNRARLAARLRALLERHDRARLAGLHLERMLYPVMMQMIGDRIAEYAGGKVVIHAALLVRMGLHRFCQLVVWVNAPLYLRLRWARRRDGRSLREVLRVLRAQRDVRRSALGQQPPSMVVENRGNRARLAARLRALLERHELQRD